MDSRAAAPNEPNAEAPTNHSLEEVKFDSAEASKVINIGSEVPHNTSMAEFSRSSEPHIEKRNNVPILDESNMKDPSNLCPIGEESQHSEPSDFNSSKSCCSEKITAYPKPPMLFRPSTSGQATRIDPLFLTDPLTNLAISKLGMKRSDLLPPKKEDVLKYTSKPEHFALVEGVLTQRMDKARAAVMAKRDELASTSRSLEHTPPLTSNKELTEKRKRSTERMKKKEVSSILYSFFITSEQKTEAKNEQKLEIERYKKTEDEKWKNRLKEREKGAEAIRRFEEAEKKRREEAEAHRKALIIVENRDIEVKKRTAARSEQAKSKVERAHEITKAIEKQREIENEKENLRMKKRESEITEEIERRQNEIRENLRTKEQSRIEKAESALKNRDIVIEQMRTDIGNQFEAMELRVEECKVEKREKIETMKAKDQEKVKRTHEVRADNERLRKESEMEKNEKDQKRQEEIEQKRKEEELHRERQAIIAKMRKEEAAINAMRIQCQKNLKDSESLRLYEEKSKSLQENRMEKQRMADEERDLQNEIEKERFRLLNGDIKDESEIVRFAKRFGIDIDEVRKNVCESKRGAKAYSSLPSICPKMSCA